MAAAAAVLAAVFATAVVAAAEYAAAVVAPNRVTPVVGRSVGTAVPARPPTVPGAVTGTALLPPAAAGGSRVPAGVRWGVTPGTGRPTTAAAATRLPAAAVALATATGPLAAVPVRAAAGLVVAAPTSSGVRR